MESFEESNCHSMSDSFSLYNHYMRSFNVVEEYIPENNAESDNEVASCRNNVSDTCSNNICGGNDNLTVPVNVDNKYCYSETVRSSDSSTFVENNLSTSKFENCDKNYRQYHSPAASFIENTSVTSDTESTINEKSVPVSSEEFQSHSKQPVFITSIMENSNNAVDSIPMFRDIRHSETVFKPPISELTFNGTLKHVQKLNPIVDPITVFANRGLVLDHPLDGEGTSESEGNIREIPDEITSSCEKISDLSSNDRIAQEINGIDNTTESTGDSQYDELNKKECFTEYNKTNQENDSGSKLNMDQSHSSFEASFDSGVRSPDMFSEGEAEANSEPFWSFLKEYEMHDRRKIRKMEQILQGVLPPPSVTILKMDVTEMLRRYYINQSDPGTEVTINTEVEASTPTKHVSFIDIPAHSYHESFQDTANDASFQVTDKCKTSSSEAKSADTSLDKSIDLKMWSETEAKETAWPDIVKCKYYDVYYNVTKYSETLESMYLRYGERYVGAETDSSVCVHSGGMQSPSSASKRKALRLKLAQAKSPGRRLSHLARRRQAFCSAATISEKAHTSSSKMVLIDKNYFPHKKLVNTSSEWKSPRKRTPRKKTPGKKTPGKKTPSKTPKLKSGGSSQKKAMRRLLMDSDSLTRSQPSRESLRRALFLSPETRKAVPQASTSSVPLQAMKSKRALFGSPVRAAETKSLDGTASDNFMLKRKRDAVDDVPESSRCKIAKSLSFGGDNISAVPSPALNRRASEVLPVKAGDTNEHKKKLLWAVSEALRIHGWRMSSPGFREKASALARLTRKMLCLPFHAARIASPNLSTSDTMFKLAKQYVFSIIQGRSIEECFKEEQMKLARETNSKVSGYISMTDYQLMKSRQAQTCTSVSQVKENTCSSSSVKNEHPRSASKNILQDKLLNIDTSSNSSSGFSNLDNTVMYKSNSMPSFEEVAKMRARRQISFDNVDFPKR